MAITVHPALNIMAIRFDHFKHTDVASELDDYLDSKS